MESATRSSLTTEFSAPGSGRRHKKKPISEQVMVITGATSGIGLATARLAARRGAKLVLAARDGDALEKICRDLRASGSEAEPVVADVAIEDDVRRIADAAMTRFGTIDTWVNNAGVSAYGRLLEIAHEDHRRIFETNFWGLVNGCREAAKRMKPNGGTIINLGSVVSDRAVPLQGMYSASKHAVKAYTDALRMELEHDGAPIAVTLIKPAAIDTPYTRHAKTLLGEEPQNPPPLYDPYLVADAIVACAVKPRRDVYIGGGGFAIMALARLAPRLGDLMMEKTMFAMQRSGRPPHEGSALYEPLGPHRERSGDPHMLPTRRTSLRKAMSLHPFAAAATAALATGSAFVGMSMGIVRFARALR
jgi:NAD(P)-dependent dehydrogenase (short-subunit alcohol dehydrogenase family)